jgi:hypothetical protein
MGPASPTLLEAPESMLGSPQSGKARGKEFLRSIQGLLAAESCLQALGPPSRTMLEAAGSLFFLSGVSYTRWCLCSVKLRVRGERRPGRAPRGG